jgi:FkbM family methyltransferase
MAFIMPKGNRHRRSPNANAKLAVLIIILGCLAFFEWNNRQNMDASVLRTSDIDTAMSGSTTLRPGNIDTAVSGSTTLSPGKFVPVSCFDLLEQVKADSAEDPNMGQVHGRKTKTNPPFYILLHNEGFDKMRWRIMNSGSYYETAMTQAFQEVLKTSPGDTRVIDVGGNVGWFSLLSAATKRSVTIDTFEPNIKNRMRYCESQAMNRWFHTEFDGHSSKSPRLNLYNYGVGNSAGTLVFQENKGNPGAGKFTEQKASVGESLEIITLDSFAKERGWLQSRPDIAILKVDVEGLEYRVMEGAKELLKAGIVRNLLVEVSARSDEKMTTNVPFIEFLAKEAKYDLYMIGGKKGPNKKVDWPNNDMLTTNIYNATLKEPWKQLNLWYKLRQ